MVGKFSKLVLHVVFSVLIFEGSLRVFGYHPVVTDAKTGTIPLVLEDAEIGWILKPGRHLQKTQREEFEIIVSSLGTRGPAVQSPWKEPIFLLGDSFTMGTGLTEGETLNSQLQILHPGRLILNFGTIGYSSCQSFLMMKRILSRHLFSGGTFLYGFNPHHELRNIVEPSLYWRYAYASPSGKAPVPRCLFSADDELDSSIVEYTAPLADIASWSSSLTLLLDYYYRIRDRVEQSDPREVSLRLIERMKKLAESHKMKFLVYLQEDDSGFAEYYMSALQSRSIETLDLTRWPESDGRMARDGSHPGPATTQMWAKELSHKGI